MLAVGSDQQRHRHRDLRALAVTFLEDAPHHQIPQLIGAAEFNIRLNGHRIHSL